MDTPTTETPETTSLSLLAKKHFKGFAGEVQEAATPEETPEEITEQPEEEQVEELESAEAEHESSEDPPSETEEEETVSSLDELIQSQEWDEEWANNLAVSVKVDGEEKPVTLSELRANFQIQEAAEKRLEEAKQVKESAKAEVAAQTEAAKQNLVTAAAIIEEAEKVLNGDIEDTNFKELERVDPAEAALKKVQFQERRQNLDALKQKAVTQYQQAVTQNQEEAQKALAQTLQEEGVKLIEKIPGWSNEKTAQAEKASVSKYLVDLGFSENEISNAYDHRMIVLAYKAMQHDEGLKKLEPAKKKLKVVKKTIPPGKQKTTSQINSERINQKRAQLRKSGKFDDALSLLRGT